MKNFFSIILVLLCFSCENDIDINAEWLDIPVVYAILDSGTQEDADGSAFEMPSSSMNFNFDEDSEPDYNSTHFIRVQKSFLGSSPAYSYTNSSDSIYYNEQELSVWVELVDPSWSDDVIPAKIPLELVNDIDLQALDIIKDDGLFNSDKYHLYKLPVSVSDLCQGACDNIYKDYKICILNPSTGDTVFSQTNIVQPLSMFRPVPRGSRSILRLGSDNTPISIEINPSRNAKMYSISLTFNYLEQPRDSFLFDKENNLTLPTSGVVQKSVTWTFGDVVVTDQDQLNGSGNYIKKTFYGPEFFAFLQSNISEQDLSQPEFYRYPLYSFFQNNNDGVVAGIYHRCVDLNITAVNSELYTYLSANGPNYGFNQERPEYNNITNGIGHVSARSILNMNNLRINQEAGDSLSFGQYTKKLNFGCYSNLGTSGLTVDFGYYCE